MPETVAPVSEKHTSARHPRQVRPDWAIFEGLLLQSHHLKLAQIYCDSLGFFDKHQCSCKNFCDCFWATSGIIWATVYYNVWSHCVVTELPRCSMNSIFIWVLLCKFYLLLRGPTQDRSFKGHFHRNFMLGWVWAHWLVEKIRAAN